MSAAALRWARSQTCGSMAPKAILVYLAGLSDDDGNCSPGIRDVCRAVECDDKTARKAIQHLLEAGLIEREHRNALGLAPVYHLAVPTNPATARYATIEEWAAACNAAVCNDVPWGDAV
jgi:pyocin large subunit-like protein